MIGKLAKIAFWTTVGLGTGIFALGLIALGESNQELE
tara:strand:+ start:613 stop:723 length:111 start_codon:yes stop_codon:yes gene_type:complete